MSRGSRSRPRRSCAALPRTIPAVRIAGVILNRVGSERHRALVADAIAALGIPVLGARAARRGARAAGTASRPGAGRRACRPRARCRPPRRRSAERHLDLDAIMAHRRRRSRSAHRADARGAAAARPAHRAGARSRLQLRLSASARRLARRRRRDRRRSRRWPTSRRPSDCDAAGCRAAIRNCTPARSPRARHFRAGLRALCARRGRCMASAAATWCWARPRGRRRARATPMTGLLGHATSFAKRKLHLGYRAARLLSATVLGNPVRSFAAMNSTMPRSRPPAATSLSPNSPTPKAGRWASRRPARPRHRHVLSRHRGGGELISPNDGAGSGTLRPPKFRYGGATKDYAQCSALAAED